ncbi:transducin family protein [Coccomyxa subellipsoidea C-169]|uniref:Transducin family protein n=1 Tax=Coccomyxa subellipsoidea (strain C-169) TaxID=574566 RepID=I0YRV4_COCSC|nr:transducin family protein [Coccomyxa subellipsoidea C-169]EIE21123.1 transducin family protein [Coccomyxa subellipsoidea C-169]|eukprot:XP_005645667.1 transducin family protein [Coccomyxa subellipsoidea C-169]
MVKAYLRYELSNTFGVVTSNSALVHDNSGKSVVTAALENVAVWNIRQGTLVRMLVPPTSAEGRAPAEVTQLAAAPASPHVAAGHSDGTIRIWNLETGDCEVTWTGHRRAVTALRYNRSGGMLASGSQDTDIILWDVVGETGLFRLRAHTAEVTDLAFVERCNVLVSGSKDGYVRAWDLGTQHCFQTVLGQQGEVWSLDVDPFEHQLAVGGVSAQVHLFRLGGDASNAGEAGPSGREARTKEVLHAEGSVARQAPERVALLRYSPTGHVLGCQSAGKVLELFRLRSEKEARKHMQRRKKRKRDKASGGDAEQTGTAVQEADAAGDAIMASDLLAPLQVLRAKAKIKAFAYGKQNAKGVVATVTLALSNNLIESWSVTEEECKRLRAVDAPGHRSGVRALALSSDDAVLLSAAAGAVKLWNPTSGACLRSIETGQGLCALFAPGNRHAVVGTKEGSIQILDIGASEVCDTIAAHTAAVWSVVALPDSSGFVSCSADHDVKFWEWEVTTEAPAAGAAAGPAARRLGARHVRTLKMADDVLCARISPDGRLLAVSLLDSTIQVFFMDTLKFFLSLYGHKLPVLSMDISSDSTLLISGSADKNIKIWGLDFGDCHRSIFAHSDSIMQVAFVPDTHYAFTVGKDGLVKYWDADRWELLLTLEGHKAEVWCLAVSRAGDMCVSAGADRSLRVWQRTEEPFFVEEEKEKRLESLFEADLEENAASKQTGLEEAPAETGTALAGRQTLEVLSGAESIADALELAAAEAERHRAFAAEAAAAGAPGKAPPANPLLAGRSVEEYVLAAVGRVRAGDLEQALLVLPFSDALRLLHYLCSWLARGSRVELVSRAAALLVRLHHAQLLATPSARAPLVRLRGLLRQRTQGLKDTLGFNLAAMAHLQRALKDRQQSAMA